MANTESAEKRVRQAATRRKANLFHLTRLRTYIKRVRASMVTGPVSKTVVAKIDPKAALKVATQALDKAAQKGVIKRRTAQRTISRLTKLVSRPAA